MIPNNTKLCLKTTKTTDLSALFYIWWNRPLLFPVVRLEFRVE